MKNQKMFADESMMTVELESNRTCECGGLKIPTNECVEMHTQERDSDQAITTKYRFHYCNKCNSESKMLVEIKIHDFY